MTLNKEQIAQLYLFVEKKRVLWYDLQTELVDHLANKIEEEWEQNPSYSFDTALQKVYVSFGIFGFARIVREKEEQVRKQNRKLWIAEFKNLFVWPNLIRSVVLFFTIVLLNKVIPFENLVLIVFISIVVHSIVKIFYDRINKKSKKKLLLIQHLYMPNILSTFYFQFWLFCLNFDDNGTLLNINEYALIAIIYGVVLSYIVTYNIGVKVYSKAKTLYPEAFEIVK